MVAIPTNYKMGSGLAATIMGQQAGLEAEQQGLANTIKAMQMPAEALKGQEAAMLMQDPNYLQQKTANTLIELGNTYQANDFQQTLNAANRVKIQLDAAGGDKAKEQQIVMQALSALKMDPNSEFGQYAMRDPRGALDKFIQGTEVAMSRSAKQIGAEQLAGIKGENALEQIQARGSIQQKLAAQRVANAIGRPKSMTQLEAEYRERVAKNPNDEEAVTGLQAINQDKLNRATASSQSKNEALLKLLKPGSNAPAPQAKPQSYNYVPGQGLVAQ